MYPAEDSICGLIEFQPAEARLALRNEVGSDETLHDTLLSLAQDLLYSTAADYDGWVSEAVIPADVESLAEELSFLYASIDRRRRAS